MLLSIESLAEKYLVNNDNILPERLRHNIDKTKDPTKIVESINTVYALPIVPWNAHKFSEGKIKLVPDAYWYIYRIKIIDGELSIGYNMGSYNSAYFVNIHKNLVDFITECKMAVKEFYLYSTGGSEQISRYKIPKVSII